MNLDDFEAGCAAIREAAGQRAQDVTQDDVYRAGWLLTDAARSLIQLAGDLRTKVGAYPGRYVLRDDEGTDPAVRITQAVTELDALTRAFAAAEQHAAAFHSAFSHIAVDVDPDAEQATQ
ncbi:hypothetical protein ABT352_32975 [Streptosporangium sp. NPDC000563]|uniref:hypothetical protein n=1 Tax=Streptosporangium sp. NPDC000563 TaxID=3154366 RepID=UPI00332E1A05